MPEMRDRIAMNRLDFGFDVEADRRSLWSPDGMAGYSENDGLWFYDPGQRIGVHSWLGHSGEEFPNGFGRMTVFLPDGTLLVMAHRGPSCREDTPSGEHLWVRCDAPFERWSHGYDGPVIRTDADALRAGPPSRAPAERLVCTIHARMLAPAFPQGAFFRNQADYRATNVYRYNGGFRFEQLLFADATLLVDGRWLRISGPGMRTHRKGARVMATSDVAAVKKYVGHSWMHAIFPSGLAIYYMYHGAESPTEQPEAYVRRDGVFHRAELIDPVPMSLAGAGDTHAFTLRCALGDIRVECEVVADSFQTLLAEEFFGVQWDTANPDALGMSQAFVRYRCEGEETIAMMERSIGLKSLTRPV